MAYSGTSNQETLDHDSLTTSTRWFIPNSNETLCILTSGRQGNALGPLDGWPSTGHLDIHTHIWAIQITTDPGTGFTKNETRGHGLIQTKILAGEKKERPWLQLKPWINLKCLPWLFPINPKNLHVYMDYLQWKTLLGCRRLPFWLVSFRKRLPDRAHRRNSLRSPSSAGLEIVLARDAGLLSEEQQWIFDKTLQRHAAESVMQSIETQQEVRPVVRADAKQGSFWLC